MEARNPTGIGGFVSGEVANPNGRPLGSRNKRTKEVINQIIKSGNKDPLLTLSEISSNDPDSAIRATAANMLAPYMHSKMQSTPAPRFIEEVVVVPDFPTMESAEDYLKEIPVLLGRGEIDSQTALELSTLVRNWILSIHARSELELKKITIDGPGEQHIVVSGGLPPLPGCENLIMPQLNGHAVTNGHALEPPRLAEGDPPAPAEPGEAT